MIKAIIVDDDPDMVDLIEELFTMNDVSVIGKGYDGKQAVELYEKHSPDIVLMDMMMPKYDGLYGIENIKQIDPKAFIIACTADYSGETTSKLNSKNVPILYKPFDIKKFNSICSKIIN